MKDLKFLLLFIAIFISGFDTSSFGQGQILTITPNTVSPGQTIDIIIRAQGTSFKSGQSTVKCGPGITVNRVTVQNTITIDANITVGSLAPSGFNNVSVTTGSSTVSMNGGLQIVQIGSKVIATMVVTPVQSMHLSDFDPNNLANSPLLFTVHVYNNDTPRTMRANLTVSGQNFGPIGTAYKIFNLGTNKNISFDNRQFDKYTVANSNSDAIKNAIATGTLPSDVYVYQIQIIDNSTGKDVADANGNNFISNNVNKPELISPGNPFYSDPMAVHTKQPVFQWFSQANSYDFYLYELAPEQKSAATVANNRPVYNQKGIVGSTFLYPASAYVMQDGKVYAWQIIANYTGTTGNTTLASDLFWFTMASSSLTSPNRTLSELKISPEQINLGTNQSYKFSVKSYDRNNDTLSISPTWSVIPAEGGTVDKNGNFTAGTTTEEVAVIASYGDFTDYATVNITSSTGVQTGALTGGDAFSVDQFVRQLFGLPK